MSPSCFAASLPPASPFISSPPQATTFLLATLWWHIYKCPAFITHPSRHIATRRTGAAPAIFIAIMAGIVSLATIAWHHGLAQAAPAAALGTLNFQVSKLAIDGLKVVTVFYIRNLVMALRHPERYGQLRAPLVEQHVPDDEAARPAAAVVRPAGVGAASGAGAASSAATTVVALLVAAAT